MIFDKNYCLSVKKEHPFFLTSVPFLLFYFMILFSKDTLHH